MIVRVGRAARHGGNFSKMKSIALAHGRHTHATKFVVARPVRLIFTACRGSDIPTQISPLMCSNAAIGMKTRDLQASLYRQRHSKPGHDDASPFRQRSIPADLVFDSGDTSASDIAAGIFHAVDAGR